MLEALASLGLMAVTAFVAATVFPAQSELVFIGLLKAGTASPAAVFIVASLFNTAGAFTNWLIGRLIASGGIERLPARLRPTPGQLASGEAQFRRWGWISLVFSWLPVVGDIATVAAGALHYPAMRFLLFVGLGKSARYGALWAGYTAFV